MPHFRYVTRKEASPLRKELMEFIRQIQIEVKSEFTFVPQFIGSSSRNMITCIRQGNTGFDFDIDILVNNPRNLSPVKIHNILFNAIRKHIKSTSFSNLEDSTRVITIKAIKKHNEIIDDFQNNQDSSLEKYKNTVFQRFFDIAFLNNLKEKEKYAKDTYDDIEALTSLLGTEKQLAIAEMNYDIIKQTKATVINMINFYTAIEKYLRLCIVCYPRREEIDTGNRALNRIASFTIGDLFYCFSNNRILFENISIDQRSDLLLYFEAIRKARNTEAHQGQGIKKEDAENWVNKIYEFLKLVSEAFNI
ncbi:hypothetical protein [Ruminococcus flavefaciens]|uniref:Uncharacterized protein n=1 Tax=Ruminococcus flavefaciens TaxID=1265 RepID=A0A1K1MHM6_RUMFL|nr:hypothetical protein [Ruminococcus flavefaciens]SFW22603.1 hypothetical protein SAMN02910280_1215 [Ruminococcus flavefaciens]